MTGNLVAARRNVILFSFISVLFLLVPVINTDSLLIMTICLSVASFLSWVDHRAYLGRPDGYYAKYVGIASGLMNAGSAVAGIISPIVFGIIIDKTGTGVYHSTGNSSHCLLLVYFWRSSCVQISHCKSRIQGWSGLLNLAIWTGWYAHLRTTQVHLWKEEISVLNSNVNPLSWLSIKITHCFWTLLRLWMLVFPMMTEWFKQLRDERQGKRQKPPW